MSSSSGGLATRMPFLAEVRRAPQTKTWGLDRKEAAARKAPRELRLSLWELEMIGWMVVIPD